MQSRSVIGHLRQDGNFIFYWDDNFDRKMVLVSNTGNRLMSGLSKDQSGETWKIPSTWEHKGQMGYTIENFVGVSNGKLSWLLSCHIHTQKNRFNLRRGVE